MFTCPRPALPPLEPQGIVAFLSEAFGLEVPTNLCSVSGPRLTHQPMGHRVPPAPHLERPQWLQH